MTGQTRVESFIEACVNTLIGLGVSLVANQLILPHYGTHLTLSNSVQISLAYTGVSVLRGYIIRRWFNTRIKAAIHAAVG